MRIHAIAENKFTDLADQLNRNLHQMGKSELQGIVLDPETTVRLIQSGAKLKTYVLADEKWVKAFASQWHLLKEETILDIVEQVHKETIDKYNQLQNKSQQRSRPNTEDIFKQEEVLVEGIGGFLKQLFKWTVFMIQLIAAVSGYGGRGGYRGRYGGREATNRDLRIMNPFVVFHLTRGLYQASLATK